MRDRLVGRGWGDKHHHHEDVTAVIDNAVLDPGRGKDRLARLEASFPTADRHATCPFNAQVYLIEIAVGVGFLGLAWSKTVEIELSPAAPEEQDLLHSFLRELDPILDPHPVHRLSSCKKLAGPARDRQVKRRPPKAV
jgi:hypothetical protein